MQDSMNAVMLWAAEAREGQLLGAAHIFNGCCDSHLAQEIEIACHPGKEGSPLCATEHRGPEVWACSRCGGLADSCMLDCHQQQAAGDVQHSNAAVLKPSAL